MSSQDSIDRDAIRQTILTYTIRGDRADLPGLAAAFTDDGVLEFAGEASMPGPAGVIERLRPRGAGDPALTIARHHLTTCMIEIDGDEARGRTYFMVLTDIGLDHQGIYVDRFRRTARGWLIAHRQVRIDWQAEHSLIPRMPVRGRAA